MIFFKDVEMKEKLFTSANSKKGIFLKIEGDKLKASVWKKETPVSIVLDIDTAFQVSEFIKENLEHPDDKDGKDKNEFWKKYIKTFIDDRSNLAPNDAEERVMPEPASNKCLLPNRAAPKDAANSQTQPEENE